MRTPLGICSQFFFGAVALLMLSTSRADYLLGPNDLIRITVYGNEDLATETRISDSGKISFPLLGEIEVGGLSVGEAENLIERLLSDQGYVRDPQVNIAVQEYRSHEVAVLGFVNNPGRYALDTATTVTQLIALAGGVNPQGDDRTIVTRVRNGKTYREELNLKELLEEGKATEDIVAEAGDVIFVPRAPVFYIHGEVQRPGAYRLERNMTVAQAISLGGCNASRQSAQHHDQTAVTRGPFDHDRRGVGRTGPERRCDLCRRAMVLTVLPSNAGTVFFSRKHFQGDE